MSHLCMQFGMNVSFGESLAGQKSCLAKVSLDERLLGPGPLGQSPLGPSLLGERPLGLGLLDESPFGHGLLDESPLGPGLLSYNHAWS